VNETDLSISSDGGDIRQSAATSVYKHRNIIEEYITTHPLFLTSLVPLSEDIMAPPIIKDMLRATQQAGVGPMASVAGAMAEYVGKDLLRQGCRNVIIENGGDIFIRMSEGKNIRIGIFAGTSPLSDKITLRISAKDTPLGICTSSGTVGHSRSFGKADAVCVTATSASLADAAATALCNSIKKISDITTALHSGLAIAGVTGIVIIVGDTMGARGDIVLA
jgi:ApbE superfamily uncharacterized protein (UPF0280 family)